MTNPFYVGSEDDILVDTVVNIYTSYNSSDDLESALDEHSVELQEISDHFLAIADSWKTAGELLEAAIASNGGIDILTLSVAGGVVILLVSIVILRRRSQ